MTTEHDGMKGNIISVPAHSFTCRNHAVSMGAAWQAVTG